MGNKILAPGALTLFLKHNKGCRSFGLDILRS